MEKYIKSPLNILLADDGSHHAEAAINFINDLPLTPGSAIKAITIFSPRQISEHDRMSQHLEETKQTLSRSGIDVSAELILGYPAEKIVEISNQLEPNLIVVGAKGLRATMGILLGGVAQQVVEYVDYPVLIVRAPYKKLQRALLVTDGSRYSDHASQYISQFPLQSGIEFQVMHVLPPLPTHTTVAQTWPIGPEIFEPASPDWNKDIEVWRIEDEKKGQEVLEGTIRKLQEHGIDPTGLIKRGDAATEIINYIKDNPVELIVAGSRGLNPIRGWLLGSVSRKLIHYANCSVLVVKGKAEDV